MTKTVKYKKKKKRSKQRTFTKKNYNNSDGFLTSTWGPPIWHYLHTMSFNYPVHPSVADKKHYRDFILNLQYVLPCKFCRENLIKNFKELPLTLNCMTSRETFSKYIFELHELVNRMLNKHSNLTYIEVRDRYEHFRSRCNDTASKQIQDPKIEKGCTDPLHGLKSKCVLKIVPFSSKEQTMKIDKKCVPH